MSDAPADRLYDHVFRGALIYDGSGGAPFAGAASADTESSDEKRKPRYRESEEVKTFYRVNRYPS